MKLVVQRVTKASCKVDGAITGQIDQGFMVLVGFCAGDDIKTVTKLATKLSKLRVFDDKQGKMNKSIFDVSGKILSISQFTLYADCKSGNRPSFSKALEPVKAKELYEYFNEYLRTLNLKVETGLFGAMMEIDLINDGPVTIIIDSEEL